MTRSASLGALFEDAVRAYPERVALVVRERAFSYRELGAWAGAIAGVIAPVERTERLGAVLASRSGVAYAGVLGTLMAGLGYVPLNPKFPALRTAHMLNASGSRTLVVGSECLRDLGPVLDGAIASLVVVLPDVEDVASLRASHPRHRFVGAAEVTGTSPVSATAGVDGGQLAYLLFTSGSTGAPKGVMVSHGNVRAFLAAMWSRYGIEPTDRFSQSFDLTFDLSAFDLFVAWGRGASVHCIPAESLLAPDEFIRAHELTVWFSVPSVGMMMRKLRRLTPNAFPSVRLALFCGERLPAVVAEDWQRAAPNAIVENLYGPTEVTIACTLYRWHAASPAACVDGVVPIGAPYPAMDVAIVDEALARVERGELCLCGPQVALGYWQDAPKTAERFVTMPWDPDPGHRWYRTGDLAYRDADGQLIHAGRNDDQVKVRGFRVELPEVEHAIREVAGTSFAVVLPYPADASGVHGLTAVVASGAQSMLDEDAILDGVKARLPEYMVPSRVMFVADLPLNANGKIDKPALLARLREEDA